MQKDKFNGNIQFFDELELRKAQDPSPEKPMPKYPLILREGEEKYIRLNRNFANKNSNFNNYNKNFTEKNNEHSNFPASSNNNYNNNFRNQNNFKHNGFNNNNNINYNYDYKNSVNHNSNTNFISSFSSSGSNFNLNNQNNFNTRNNNFKNSGNNFSGYNTNNYNNRNNYNNNYNNSRSNSSENFNNNNAFKNQKIYDNNYQQNSNYNLNNNNYNNMNKNLNKNEQFKNQRNDLNNSTSSFNTNNFTFGNNNNYNNNRNHSNDEEDFDFMLLGPMENKDIETKQKERILSFRNNNNQNDTKNRNYTINNLNKNNESINEDELDFENLIKEFEEEEKKSNENFKANKNTNADNDEKIPPLAVTLNKLEQMERDNEKYLIEKKREFASRNLNTNAQANNSDNFNNTSSNLFNNINNKNNFSSGNNNSNNLNNFGYGNNKTNTNYNNNFNFNLNYNSNFNNKTGNKTYDYNFNQNSNTNFNNDSLNRNNSNKLNNYSNNNNNNYEINYDKNNYSSNNNNNFNFKNNNINYNQNNKDNNYNYNNNDKSKNNNYPNNNNNMLPVPIKNYEDAKLAEWSRTFPWEGFINQINLKIFANKSFRPLQREIINAVLSKRDVFVCIPTGGGKSLTFQLSSIVSPGVSVIIMPLVSLIQDQKSFMSGLGIKVFVPGKDTKEIDNLMDKYEESFKTLDDVKGINMIFLTPERVNKSGKINNLLKRLYNDRLLDRFVIDEAHCLSTWGREFRVDYLELKKIREIYPDIPIMAITATATNAIRSDVIAQLKMQKAVFFRASYNRPNLFLELRPKVSKKKMIENIVDFINTKYKGKSGIIYCTSKQDCEDLNAFLKQKKIKSNYYHADRNENEKNLAQEKWKNDEINVIVATIAFGMGINKADVRYVIHSNFPKSFESYYQEIGRAGRDFKDSHCLLYYDQGDRKSLNWLLHKNKQMKPFEKDNNIRLLNLMQSYCENDVECRRVLVLNYFDEEFNPKDCKGKCDNCLRNRKITYKDFSKEIKTVLEFLSLQSEFDLRFTLLQLVSFLRGVYDKSEKIKSINDENLLEFKGYLKSCDAGALSRLIRLLIVKGLLTESLVAVNGPKQETVFAVIEITRDGFSFLARMQRKEVKAEEMNKFKIAVIDYSAAPENDAESNIERVSEEFDNLVENAIKESEGYINNDNNKKKKKNNNKAKKGKKENSNELFESDVGDETVNNNKAKNIDKKNKKNEKIDNKNDYISISDNSNLSINLNNYKNTNNYNHDNLEGVVFEDEYEYEYVQSQFDTVAESRTVNKTNDVFNNKQNKKPNQTNNNFNNINTNSNNHLDSSLSDSVLNILNNLDELVVETNVAPKNSNINNSNKNNNNASIINKIQTINLIKNSDNNNLNPNEDSNLNKMIDINFNNKKTKNLNNNLMGSNTNEKIPSEIENTSNCADENDLESELSDNYITIRKRVPKKSKPAETLQPYPQQFFQQEEDYGDLLTKEQFEELFEKLKLIRLNLFRKFNRKIPENLSENEVDLDDLDLEPSDVKIGLDDIFPNTGLRELCRKIPTSEEELDNNYIFGVGVQCLKKYGVYFLGEIRLFLEKNNVLKEKINFKEKFETEKKESQKNSEYSDQITKLRQSTAHKKENNKNPQQRNYMSKYQKSQKSTESQRQAVLNDFLKKSQSSQRINNINNVVININRNSYRSFKNDNNFNKNSKSNSASKSQKQCLLQKKLQETKIYKNEFQNNFPNEVGSATKQLQINAFFTNDPNINNKNSNFKNEIDNTNNPNKNINLNVDRDFVYEDIANYKFPNSDDSDYEEKLKALDSNCDNVPQSNENNQINLKEKSNESDYAANCNKYIDLVPSKKNILGDNQNPFTFSVNRKSKVLQNASGDQNNNFATFQDKNFNANIHLGTSNIQKTDLAPTDEKFLNNNLKDDLYLKERLSRIELDNNFNRNSLIFNQENNNVNINKIDKNSNREGKNENDNKNKSYSRGNENNENINNYNNRNNINIDFNFANKNKFNNYVDFSENNNEKISENNIKKDGIIADPEIQNILNYNNFENECLLESADNYADEYDIEGKLEAIPINKNNKAHVEHLDPQMAEFIGDARKIVYANKKHKRQENWNENDSDYEREQEKKQKRQDFFRRRAWRGKMMKKK